MNAKQPCVWVVEDEPVIAHDAIEQTANHDALRALIANPEGYNKCAVG